MNRQMQGRVYGLMGAVALSLLGTQVSAQETPQTANRFCDSIGINTHLTSTSYTTGNFYNTVELPLAWLGVRHIRDYMVVDDGGSADPSQPNPGYAAIYTPGYTAASDSENDYYNKLKALGNQGVKCDLSITPVGWYFTNRSSSLAYQMVPQSLVITNTFLLGCQEAVEGANEWDHEGPGYIGNITDTTDPNYNSTWQSTFNKETSDIWSNYRGNSSTAGMQIYSGTIIDTNGDPNIGKYPDTNSYVNGTAIPPASATTPAYGNVSSKVDYGSYHLYCYSLGSNYPEYGLAHLIPGSQLLWGPAAPAAPGPFVITETGYYTPPSGSPQSSVTPIVQEKYTLRTLFTTFNYGAYRTYLYELYDEGGPTNSDGSPDTISENFYGLIDNSGNDKPAYNALESLINLLSDASTSTAVTPLTWSLGGTTANVKHTLLQKSDGSYYLALWLGVGSTDSAQSQAVTVTVPSTIAAGSLYTINQYGSMSNPTPVTLKSGKMSVNVTDTVSVLKLTGPIIESTPLALSQTSVSKNGGQVTATVTYKNVSATAMTFLPYIGARDASGNNVDFGAGSSNSSNSNVTLQPGQTVSVSAPKTLSTGMNTGTWSVFGSYRTASNVWYNLSPTLSLTVTN